MVTSELIKLLSEALDRHGDLEVLIKDDGYFSEDCEIYHPPFDEPYVAQLSEAATQKIKPDASILSKKWGTVSGKCLIIGKTIDRP
ncbi:hypothetical protein RF847_004604 [Salmonella enterica]|nr:hypothetical protein [Salmonella enterica]